MPSQRNQPLCRNINVAFCLIHCHYIALHGSPSTFYTSTVSSTLITPGCRNVRSFFTAFLAIGRRDLFAVTSKENILQFDPSSCILISTKDSTLVGSLSYALGSIEESPNARIDVDSIAEGVGKWWPF
jgi:hypothetical protein